MMMMMMMMMMTGHSVFEDATALALQIWMDNGRIYIEERVKAISEIFLGQG